MQINAELYIHIGFVDVKRNSLKRGRSGFAMGLLCSAGLRGHLRGEREAGSAGHEVGL